MAEQKAAGMYYTPGELYVRVTGREWTPVGPAECVEVRDEHPVVVEPAIGTGAFLSAVVTGATWLIANPPYGAGADD